MDVAGLAMATANASAFWTTMARVRRARTIARPGFLATIGDARIGMRILVLTATPSPADRAAMSALVHEHASLPTTLEDAFSTIDVDGLPLEPKQMPVMIRKVGPAGGTGRWEVTRVEVQDDLRTAERVVVDGFPLSRVQPYREGEAFPDALLGYPGASLFVVGRDGRPAGACLTISDSACTGVYWVATLPEFRSQGAGRALMHAVITHHEERPITLTASDAGVRLYESLGFHAVGLARWSSSPAGPVPAPGR